MSIREKIFLIQQLSGKSQTEVALNLGMSFAALNRWVNGKAKPRRSTVEKIDKILASYNPSGNPETYEINYKISYIDQLKKKHPNILKYILGRTDLIDEYSLQITYNSNAIEGSTLTQEETREVIFENRALGRKPFTEQIEAKNHHMAFLFLLEHLKEKRKINVQFLIEIHRKLMFNLRTDAGFYRNHPVRILGTYVPTANYLKVPKLVDELFVRKSNVDFLEFTAKFHADFEKIHPFSDGNGRVGRLIMIGMLIQKNFAPAIIQKKKRKIYYQALQKAQLDENYTSISSFICDAVIEGFTILT